MISHKSNAKDESEFSVIECCEENSFAAGIIQNNEERTRLNQGAGSLPWLFLTDGNDIVTAEDFSLDEINEKIKEAQNVER